MPMEFRLRLVQDNFDTHIILALEVGARYTFSMKLDGSEPEPRN